MLLFFSKVVVLFYHFGKMCTSNILLEAHSWGLTENIIFIFPSKLKCCLLNWIIIWIWSYVTLDHKTSLKCQFFKIEMHTSESWLNKLFIDVWFVMIGQYLADTTIWKSGIWGCKKNLNIEKITFKVIQMKFLVMHIINQMEFWYIYGYTFSKYIHGTWFLINIQMIFGINEKCIILTHTTQPILLAIATNIPQRLIHILKCKIQIQFFRYFDSHTLHII